MEWILPLYSIQWLEEGFHWGCSEIQLDVLGPDRNIYIYYVERKWKVLRTVLNPLQYSKIIKVPCATVCRSGVILADGGDLVVFIRYDFFPNNFYSCTIKIIRLSYPIKDTSNLA